jgi:GGDEF domain-containing protein
MVGMKRMSSRNSASALRTRGVAQEFAIHRRGFLKASERMLKEESAERPWAMLLSFYIEHFEVITRALGTAAGERLVLRTIHAVHAVFPDNAVLGRIGCDEFVVLMKVANTRAGAELLARLVNCVDIGNAAAAGPGVSLSGGFRQFDPRHPIRLSDLLRAAEKHMAGQRTDAPIESRRVEQSVEFN